MADRLSKNRMMIVDDDPTFCETLHRAMRTRGFDVCKACGIKDALQLLVEGYVPDFAIVDLKLHGESGLDIIGLVHDRNPDAKILLLTGYASISTAVQAIKLGATNYLSKPANADEIFAAFVKETSTEFAIVPMTIRQRKLEYLNQVLMENGGSISATARALNMDRRSLQRMLAKKASN